MSQKDTDMRVRFVTDTASLSIFDEVALRHRLDAPADWWADPGEEVREVNTGNVIFVGLGADGTYTASVYIEAGRAEGRHVLAWVEAKVRCPSGRLFIGAGEDVVGAGAGPDMDLGGRFLDISPGVYRVTLVRLGLFELEVRVEAITETAENFIENPLTL